MINVFSTLLILLSLISHTMIASAEPLICSQLNVYIGECEEDLPIEKLEVFAFPVEEIDINKGEVFKLKASGGALPIRWSPSEGLTIVQNDGGREIRLQAADDFCSGSLQASDSCGSSDSILVTAGGGCCSESVSLAWDHENSMEVMAPSSAGEVAVVGDSASKVWEVQGTGCWLDQKFTMTRIETTNNSITLFTDANSCGSCQVTVTDLCSSIMETIRVSRGRWVEIDAATCPLRNVKADKYIENNSNLVRLFYYFAYDGKYRIRQDFYTTGVSGRYESAGYRECSFTCGKLSENYPDLDTYEECKDQAISRRANDQEHPLMIDIDSLTAVTPLTVLMTQLMGNIPEEEVIIGPESWGNEKVCYSTHPTRKCRTSSIVFTVTRDYKFGPRSAPAPRVWEWVCD